LRDAGATPVALPLIRIEPSSRPDELRGAIERLASGSYAWLVITSGNAVRALVDARTSDPNLVPPSNLRVAAVGQATAQRLRGARWRVDLVPKDQTAAGLVAAFHGVDLQGQRVLCLLGNLARATLAEGLREQDAIVEVVEAYRTKPVERLSDEVRRLLSDGEIDVVTFASPSAVTAFIDLLGYEEVSMPSAAIACIGPTTRAAAIDHGLSVDVVAPEPSAKAFVTALSAYFAALKGDHA
jgi:uroporphyrinogen III methyltransferase/synthase